MKMTSEQEKAGMEVRQRILPAPPFVYTFHCIYTQEKPLNAIHSGGFAT
jgi:hypothetical protein